MPSSGWEHFHHVADIGLRGYGSTVAEAFEQTALALTAVISDPAIIAPETSIDIRCEAPDYELLLVDWLNIIIYEMATRSMLFSRFSVRITGTALLGKAWGERVNVQRHAPAVEVKGATYTELSVQQQADGQWRSQCVVDV